MLVDDARLRGPEDEVIQKKGPDKGEATGDEDEPADSHSEGGEHENQDEVHDEEEEHREPDPYRESSNSCCHFIVFVSLENPPLNTF